MLVYRLFREVTLHSSGPCPFDSLAKHSEILSMIRYTTLLVLPPNVFSNEIWSQSHIAPPNCGRNASGIGNSWVHSTAGIKYKFKHMQYKQHRIAWSWVIMITVCSMCENRNIIPSGKPGDFPGVVWVFIFA